MNRAKVINYMPFLWNCF